jgi:serine/threonine-protein kinase RsbW
MGDTSVLSVAVEGTSPPLLRVRGEADFHNRGQIYDTVKSLIDDGHMTVHADLSELSYMDSSALSMLVKCAAEVREAGGIIELTGTSSHVSRVLTKCGATLFFGTGLDEDLADGRRDGVAAGDSFWRVSDFSLPARPESALIARQRVVDVVGALPLGASDSVDVMIAFGEAVANAIRHGCGCDPEQRITVKCIAFPGRLAIDVIDPGPGFTPSEVPAPSPKSILDGGMGIYIMRELMDEVEFLFDQGTTARLVKHLPAKDYT